MREDASLQGCQAAARRRNPTAFPWGGTRPMGRLVLPVVAIALAALGSGCAATIQSVRTDPSVQLRQYRRLALVLTDATGSTSVLGAAAGGIASGQVMKGEGQAAQALNSLQFEMAALGFQLVGTLGEAQLVGEFSVGQIRFDPLAGWVADQAMLVLKEPAGNTVALFRAKSSGITPTVNNLVSQIAKAVRQTY